tara:strand:- start:719 stop:961 length:243 start_codon:yes stop_codon:yes gene_type:complete
MQDNDRLLEDYGDKVERRYEDPFVPGQGLFDIIHAIPTGKRNVTVIKVRQAYNLYDAGSLLSAIRTARDNYKEMKNLVGP